MRGRGAAALGLGLVWLACAAGALLHRLPLLVGARPVTFVGVILLGLGGLAVAGVLLRRGARRPAIAVGLLFAAPLVLLGARQVRFAWARHRVTSATEKELAPLGARFLVGYRRLDEALDLARRGAVAGIYLTDRNVRGRTAADVAREVEALQRARRLAGMPPLVIAADQEGGLVEHLSPPLVERPSLGDLAVRHADDPVRLEAAVRSQARAVGRELREIGVTLDLAPVVDLETDARPGLDLFSQIARRAIARDPARVKEIAGWFCGGLAVEGVGCTLKHLPGIGKSTADSHLVTGRLEVPRAELETEDLVPFSLWSDRGGPAAIMVSHLVVPAVDGSAPASLSPALLRGVARGGLGFDGLLVSDDFSMFPVALGPGGVGGAACRGLAAGLDLVLVAYDTDLYYEAMAALLDGCPDAAALSASFAASQARLARLLAGVRPESERGP